MRRLKQKSWRPNSKPPLNAPYVNASDFTPYVRSMAQTMSETGEGTLVLLGCLESFMERRDLDTLRAVLSHRCIRLMYRQTPKHQSFREFLKREIASTTQRQTLYAYPTHVGRLALAARQVSLERLDAYLEQILQGTLTVRDAIQAEELAQRFDRVEQVEKVAA